jgi:hypothetical protein
MAPEVGLANNMIEKKYCAGVQRREVHDLLRCVFIGDCAMGSAEQKTTV